MIGLLLRCFFSFLDEPSDDIELETETKELYSTQDIVDNESSEKLETVETEEKKEDG